MSEPIMRPISLVAARKWRCSLAPCRTAQESQGSRKPLRNVAASIVINVNRKACGIVLTWPGSLAGPVPTAPAFPSPLHAVCWFASLNCPSHCFVSRLATAHDWQRQTPAFRGWAVFLLDHAHQSSLKTQRDPNRLEWNSISGRKRRDQSPLEPW
jgi:hypothetical protein